MNRICESHDCNNTVYGRQDRKFCSERCKQSQKRFRKENNLSPSMSRTKSVVEPSGNLLSDVAISGAIGLMNNGSANPINTMGNSMIQTCAPYAVNKVKERPWISFLFAVGGFFAAAKVFTSCTTTTQKDSNGKTSKSTSCKKASPIQKTGGAAAAVLVGNAITDALINALSESNDTAMTRVIPVSDTGNRGKRRPMIPTDHITFFKAN